jgi:hypothetical protein
MLRGTSPLIRIESAMKKPPHRITPAQFIMGPYPHTPPQLELTTVAYRQDAAAGDHKDITCWCKDECRVVIQFRVNEPRQEILEILDELRADIARYEEFAVPYIERGLEEMDALNKWLHETQLSPINPSRGKLGRPGNS